MNIGLDFDNTIVCYDEVFHLAALDVGLISPDLPKVKNLVRDHLRANDQETEWTSLQGAVYGARMSEAIAFPGVQAFIATAIQKGHRISIVSHKTAYTVQGPKYDLHSAARRWLESNGFYQLGLSEENIYFELTREEKVKRIRSLACEAFVDDLPEVLEALSADIRRILFDPNDIHKVEKRFERLQDWKLGAEVILKDFGR